MGYLLNTVVTVDAILTDVGRQLLAQQNGQFKITQFALADDEIDYTLYNPNHPSGSAYYGQAIQNMPLLEAFPQATQTMKYKLVTLPRGTAKLPILDIGYSAIVIKQGASLAITPQTLNYLGGNTFESSGYTATISDVRLFSTFEGVGINTPDVQALNVANQTTTLGTSVSRTVVGSTINLRATTINTLFGSNTALYASLTIEGCVVVTSLQQAIEHAQAQGETELMITGGGSIYAEALPIADKIYLTRIAHTFNADTFFPVIDGNTFELVGEVKNMPDEKNAYAFTFETWQRK